jgi:hypothetical protein
MNCAGLTAQSHLPSWRLLLQVALRPLRRRRGRAVGELALGLEKNLGSSARLLIKKRPRPPCLTLQIPNGGLVVFA